MSLDLKSNNYQNNLKEVKAFNSGVYEFEGFRLDAAHLMLYRDGKEISLTPKQVETLLALVERSGEIVSKETLMERLWADAFVEESNLVQNIYILRKTLGETSDGKPMIETLRRRGYRFNGELKKNGHTRTGTAPREAATHSKFPSDVSDKTIAEKTEAAGWFGKNKTIAALGFVLIAAVGFGYYFFYAGETAIGGKKSIAVLPLKPINTVDRDEIYEIGIMDSLIHRLSSAKGFIVRPLSATRQYTDIAQDPLAAGREQQVDYVLASNYQLADGRVRVTSQLFNVASGQIEETYKSEKQVGDVFAMQDAIANEVGNFLLARFAIGSSNPAAKRGTTNEEAYRLYLQGNNLTARRSGSDAKKAIEYFEQAIRLDPNFARAYSGMAFAYRASGTLGGGLPRDQFEKARAAVTKALELDPNLAEAYVVRADLKHKTEWDVAGAEKDLAKAIELEPNNDLAHAIYSDLLSETGRFDQAFAEIETALEIDPASLVNQRNRGRLLYFTRGYDEATLQLKRVLEVDENFMTAYGWLWLAYAMNKDYAGAFEWFMKEQKLKNPDNLEVYQKAFEKGGWKEVIRKSLEFEKLDEGKPSGSFYRIARLYAMLGEKEPAFEYLNKAIEKRQSQLVMLNVEPAFDSLRGDLRFDELLPRIGLK